MRKFRKNEIGITLIALVITIIVLLILASVSIAILIGQNGILIQAQNAKNETEQSGKEEKEKLGSMEDVINESITGIKVEQVSDKNPGVLEGSGTADDPYTINSIEDLVVFASNVTNGTTYEGQTVKLGLSLDFNSNKSYVEPLRTDYVEYGYNGELKTLLTTGEGFKPIGTTYDANVSTNYFEGNFNGDYNTIYNLYQNFEDSNNTSIIGLFSTNGGVIENLMTRNANIISETNNMYIVSGVVAGRNNGTITNCGTSGNLKITDNGIKGIFGGGITGQAMGVIERCFSKTNIEITSNNSSQISIGGITGALTEDYINSCYNMGLINININSDKIIMVGGISGYNDGKEILNCYNGGNVNFTASCETTKEIYIGNILGQENGTNSNLSNCFNTGDMNIDMLKNSNDTTGIGSVVGYSYQGNINYCYNIGKMNFINEKVQNIGQIAGGINSATVNNCYGITGQIDVIGHSSNSAISNVKLIEENNIPDILQVIGENFKEDSSNINNGYPVLNWQ